MLRIKRIAHTDEAPLVDHLTELRSRIVASLAAFGVALGLCFWQNAMLLELLRTPIGDRQLITLGVAEPFTTSLTVSAYAAVILALPVLLYQLYAFTVPALAPGHQRAAKGLAVLVPVLFLAGAAFAFLVVVRRLDDGRGLGLVVLAAAGDRVLELAHPAADGAAGVRQALRPEDDERDDQYDDELERSDTRHGDTSR